MKLELSVATWLEYYRVATKLSNNTLLSYCHNHFYRVLPHLDLTTVQVNELCTIFEATKKSIRSTDMFNALTSWMATNKDNDKSEYFVALSKHVDFSTMPANYIKANVMNNVYISKSSELLEQLTKNVLALLKHERASLMIGGGDSDSSSKLVEYDVKSKLFSKCQDSRLSCKSSSVAVNGNLIYVFNGKDMQVYNSDKNGWMLFESILGRDSCNRSDTSSVISDQRLFILGGIEGRWWLESIKIFDLHEDGSCTPLSDHPSISMSTPRSNFCTIAKSGRIYIMGGKNYYKDILGSCESINAITYETSSMTSLQTSRKDFAAVLFNDTILVLGGSDIQGYTRKTLDSVESYSFSSDQWTVVKSLLKKRHQHSACVLNNTV